MDEHFQDLEIELKSLRPRGPSPSLLERIGSELTGSVPSTLPLKTRPNTPVTNLTSWKWFGWRTAGIAGACAALALIAFFGFFRQPTPVNSGVDTRVAVITPERAVPREQYRPVAASNVLYDLKDEGLVGEAGAAPARRLRYRYVDTYTWKDPRTNASLKWSVPRDEIRVIPASMH